jgi:hypothetical protein
MADVDDATVRIYSLKTLTEENYWDENIILEIQTSENADLVSIPIGSGSGSALEDLYESVKYKANKIDEFLDRFLKEE